MKRFGFILLMTLPSTVLAQTDSIRNDGKIKEAPEQLQKILKEMKSADTLDTTEDADIEIDGMVFDETKTKNGRDFYDYFYKDWQAPARVKNYSIYIIEKPYRLNTTQIEVKINETIVFKAFLQSRNEYIEMLAEKAVQQIKSYLQNYQRLVKQLDGEDRAGTGIY